MATRRVTLIPTERIDREAFSEIVELFESQGVPVSHDLYRVRLSASEIPQWIQVGMDAVDWESLSLGALLFSNVVGDVYEQAKRGIVFLARVLWQVVKRTGGDTSIYLNIPIPDDSWGTNLIVSPQSQQEVARSLELFCKYARAIEEAVSALMKSQQPLTGFMLSFDDKERIIIRWVDRDTNEKSITIEVNNGDV